MGNPASQSARFHPSPRSTLNSTMRPSKTVQFLIVAGLAVLASTGCERKPSEEELARQRQMAEEAAEAVQAKAKPTPKPGDWMWKDYKNPLESKKKR
jgi:hypothetical protein